MKPLINNWKSLTPFEKIALVVAVVGSIYGGITFLLDKTKDTNKQIIVFNKKTHLGDNDQSSFGGTSSPFVESPGSEGKVHLLEYDKKEQSFKSKNGFPTEVQEILNFYGGQYAKANLEAYKHVVGVSPKIDADKSYPGNSVQIDRYTKLIWRENSGEFYHQEAAVGLTATINLYQYLLNNGFSPEETSIKKATFRFHGLHSGKRPSQPDNVQIVVNRKIYPMKYKSNNVREEESIDINIPAETLNLAATGTNRFTIMVLPYQENYPVPPPKSQYEQRGPGHFRDIELWSGKLELVID